MKVWLVLDSDSRPVAICVDEITAKHIANHNNDDLTFEKWPVLGEVNP